MKLRLGFVSNSSTSSFCVIGYMIKDNLYKAAMKKAGFDGDDADYEFGESLEEKNLVAWSGGDYGFDDGKTLVGRLIMDISSDGGDEGGEEDFDPKALTKDLEEVKKIFNLGDKAKPKIYTGLRAS